MNSLIFSFKRFLTSFLTEDKELKPADLFIGRFQPFHKGHEDAINRMKNPVIVIIRGAKTSEDTEKNPLDVEQQETLIKQVFPNIPVFVSNNSGFVPAIIGMVKEHGYKVNRVFAGADRISGYKGQVERANKKIDTGKSEHERISVEFNETPRFTSATIVRDSIRSGNFDEYKTLMPTQLANKTTFKQLKSVMSSS